MVICSNVLRSYLDAYDTVPWDYLCFIFGEIMYGGHITDAWDRRTCNAYLQVYQYIGLFEGSELATGFKSPIPDEMDYKDYITYTETSMPSESPPLFGLHPNTEIGYLTNSADRLLFEILSISGGGSGEGESGNTNDAVRQTMNTLLE